MTGLEKKREEDGEKQEQVIGLRARNRVRDGRDGYGSILPMGARPRVNCAG